MYLCFISPSIFNFHSNYSSKKDGPTFDKASTEKLEPVKFDAGLAFMFETSAILKLTKHAINSPQLEQDYLKCWEGCTKKFNGKI